MTYVLFLSLFVVGAFVSAVVTEAVKKAFKNAKKEAAPNLLALINAFVVGGLGMAVAYVLLGIEWNIINIVCLCLMIVCIWMGSMYGFDKVVQMLAQIKRIGHESD